jgi:hypothetical protein
MEGKQPPLHLHAPMLSPHSFSAPDTSNESHTAPSMNPSRNDVRGGGAQSRCVLLYRSASRELETWRSSA